MDKAHGKIRKIRQNIIKFLLFSLTVHQNYTKSNIEKLQWQFEVQSNYNAIYSKPIENIANFLRFMS